MLAEAEAKEHQWVSYHSIINESVHWSNHDTNTLTSRYVCATVWTVCFTVCLFGLGRAQCISTFRNVSLRYVSLDSRYVHDMFVYVRFAVDCESEAIRVSFVFPQCGAESSSSSSPPANLEPHAWAFRVRGWASKAKGTCLSGRFDRTARVPK
jgi:hypothetical protein